METTATPARPETSRTSSAEEQVVVSLPLPSPRDSDHPRDSTDLRPYTTQEAQATSCYGFRLPDLISFLLGVPCLVVAVGFGYYFVTKSVNAWEHPLIVISFVSLQTDNIPVLKLCHASPDRVNETAPRPVVQACRFFPQLYMENEYTDCYPPVSPADLDLTSNDLQLSFSCMDVNRPPPGKLPLESTFAGSLLFLDVVQSGSVTVYGMAWNQSLFSSHGSFKWGLTEGVLSSPESTSIIYYEHIRYIALDGTVRDSYSLHSSYGGSTGKNTSRLVISPSFSYTTHTEVWAYTKTDVASDMAGVLSGLLAAHGALHVAIMTCFKWHLQPSVRWQKKKL
eukprot:gb/GEZN01012488.1/.p1 GENE.gb/GEZN01012488.1/~~gb/GEZN01012488.1/.p1  ORF type:complete len:338 (-),score=24.02 gb/GEZN01012488.1/:32-1045(-)